MTDFVNSNWVDTRRQ